MKCIYFKGECSLTQFQNGHETDQNQNERSFINPVGKLIDN